MTYHATAALLLATMLLGCGGQTDVRPRTGDDAPNITGSVPEGPAVEEVARNYSKLDVLTREPVLVDPQLAELCVGIWQQHVDDARKRSGPHAHTSIRIYMNEAGSTAFRNSVTKFPVGSVIVKEKQGLEYNSAETPSSQEAAKTSNGVGGMIKRHPGYDSAHGDWEYFYFQDPSKIEHGKLASCIECHRGASASDFVFGGWANRGSPDSAVGPPIR